MIWKFELDAVEIDEPIGFDEIVFSIQRDDLWHGIFIEASTSQLGFYGNAYTILKAAKESNGVDNTIIFTASVMCDGETEYTEAISGKLNFSQYKEACGNECIIRMSVEQDTCAMVFKNRFDQKVNIDSNIAFDKQTLLEDYTGLGFNMPLATQDVPISADADVVPTGDIISLTDQSFFYNGSLVNHQNLLVRPTYGVVNGNSIITGYLDDPLNVFQPPGDDFLLTPQVLLEDNPGCIRSDFNYDTRLKGSMVMTVTDVNPINYISIWACVDYWNGVGTHYGPGQTNGTGNAIELNRVQVGTITNPLQGVYNINFDEIFSGTVTLPVGYGIYAYIKVLHVFDDIVSGNFVTADFVFTFTQDTYFILTNNRECPPTNCEVYLINEILGRITESITDRCLTIKSDYYGRTDSQPYNSDTDGCGGLRILTQGLRIRQATDKQFFASMKEVMFGIRAIDNIGMGMESNTETNFGDWLRIESVEYFYQNIKIMDIVFIPESISEIEDRLIYSNIITGYNKWEIKSVKGIDEFCSYKERRTGIKAINNELDISTDLIGSGYIIENLRTSTLANTGQTDNTYDNDIFIICTSRTGTYYVTFTAASNSMVFITSGNGNEFLVGSITIAGTTSNNGVRVVFSVSISTLAGGITQILIVFTGGVTVDEVALHTTFTGIISSGMFVEQGITDNPANFYSPTTAYNWRIRPLYNLMRWFKSIVQCYVSLSNTTSKVFFTSGKGNYTAEGNINASDACVLENKVLAENADISVADFVNSVNSTPIFHPETIQFDYPLSIADYIAIKANPYGYINYQCGNGVTEKGYIKSIAYKPVGGKANFTLIKRWQ